MTQVFFDHELEESLANQHGGKSTKPLTIWNLKPVQIGGRQYYLYREKTSGMLVLSDNLDLQTFGYVVKRLIQKMGFLTAEQRGKLSQKMANYYSQHRFVEQIDDEALRKAVADHQNELIAELEGSSELAHNTILCRASQKLMYFLGNNDQVNEIISRVMNELHPVKINKPKSTVKYHTIQAKFEDPRKWADLVGEQSADHVTELSAIKANNQVMIKQFLTSKFGEQLVEKKATEKLLDNYLNDFLLSSEQIGLVTDNLADVNRYFWKILNSDGDEDLAVVVLTDFYKFLSQTAIINKPNIAKVRRFLQDALDIFNGKADEFSEASEASEADLTKFIHDDSVFVDEFRDQMGAMIGQGELPAGLAKYLYPLKKVPKDADGFEQSYTIKVQLAGFKPTMSRTFNIGSWETMAELQRLIIKMFRGRFEHHYDLTDDTTGECYLLPMFKDYYETDNRLVDAEKATVACLNIGDRLTLHYDYGDGWEFKLRVQSIIDLGGHTPWISSARGYGIIEDIGGVDALEDYYHDFRAGWVDPAIKEWLGGQLINLDFVSVQQLNAEIKR